MHNIAFRHETPEQYEAAMQHCPDRGVRAAMSDWFCAPGGNCKWACVNTRPMIGSFTELYYIDGVALDAFEEFRNGRLDELNLGVTRQAPYLPVWLTTCFVASC